MKRSAPKQNGSVSENGAEKAPVGPAEPTHSPDGVDLTLIRWMLSLTPAERLDVLEDHLQTILRIRGEAPNS